MVRPSPLSFDQERRRLFLVLSLATGRLVSCDLRAHRDTTVVARCTGVAPLTGVERREVTTLLRSCLRMDESFVPFHAAARKLPAYRWIARSKAGRLLRAPRMFEDAVKMISTTNCTWALTVVMIRALVTRFGRREGDIIAFPSPEALAGSSEAELRRTCSTGYRSRAIVELAERVASGHLNIEAWRDSSLSTDDLFREMCTVRGIGPYAAGNLLKLAGRYEHLGLDSWVRGKWAALHAGGRTVKDSTIEGFYGGYGQWRGLLFWLEMTRDWHDGEQREKFTVKRATQSSSR